MFTHYCFLDTMRMMVDAIAIIVRMRAELGRNDVDPDVTIGIASDRTDSRVNPTAPIIYIYICPAAWQRGLLTCVRLSLALLEPREGECLEQAEQLAGWRVRALGLPLMP